MAEQLHGNQLFSGRKRQQMTRFFVRVGKSLRGHHLRVAEAGALLSAQRAECLVGHARHGRQQHRVVGEERVQVVKHYAQTTWLVRSWAMPSAVA